MDLTDEAIAAAVAKAEARVCVGHHRCYAFPDRLEDARETCTAKGRCKVGWMVTKGGRESYDVWLEVSTGLAKLIHSRIRECAGVGLVAFVAAGYCGDAAELAVLPQQGPIWRRVWRRTRGGGMHEQENAKNGIEVGGKPESI
jgi:hypothetical protein